MVARLVVTGWIFLLAACRIFLVPRAERFRCERASSALPINKGPRRYRAFSRLTLRPVNWWVPLATRDIHGNRAVKPFRRVPDRSSAARRPLLLSAISEAGVLARRGEAATRMADLHLCSRAAHRRAL